MKNSNTNSMVLPGFTGFRHNSKSRKFGWLTVIFAVIANVLLFSSINWVNRRAVDLPAESQTAIELFKPELIQKEPMVQVDSTPVITQKNVQPKLEPMQIAMSNESMLKPRLTQWVPDTLLSQPGIKVDIISSEPVISAAPAIKETFHGPLSFDQVDDPPQKISGFSPSYPRWARSTRAEGFVVLKFIVGVDGRVSNIEVEEIQGDQRFASAAKRAVQTWRFKPAMNEGKPAAVWGIQKIRFQFEDYR